MSDALTPQKAAIRLNNIVEAVSQQLRLDRFPVDVSQLAKESANIFRWNDPITEIKAADIQKFEGALFANDAKSAWMLLYNSRITSSGRVRFTQAHELGHYILHRQLKDEFQCTDADMRNWDKQNIEAQADVFASYLLMPLDDYRKQLTTEVDLDVLGHCADRYGVSLTAAILKWLEHTDENAVLVVSRDGFIDWSKASARAMKAGAFFKTRNNTIPVPDASVASNTDIIHDRHGIETPARIWFPHAHQSMVLREMKLHSEQYNCVFTILKLPRSATVWEPWQNE